MTSTHRVLSPWGRGGDFEEDLSPSTCVTALPRAALLCLRPRPPDHPRGQAASQSTPGDHHPSSPPPKKKRECLPTPACSRWWRQEWAIVAEASEIGSQPPPESRIHRAPHPSLFFHFLFQRKPCPTFSCQGSDCFKVTEGLHFCEVSPGVLQGRALPSLRTAGLLLPGQSGVSS